MKVLDTKDTSTSILINLSQFGSDMARIQETRPLRFEELPKHEGHASFQRQLFASSPILIIVINIGMVFGYSATLLPELEHPTSDIKVSAEEASWIASVVPLTMVVGSLLAGPLVARFGRKNVQFFICVPVLVGWVTIYVTPNVEILLIGRAICGASVGLMAAVFPSYIGEITAPKYRGMLTSATTVNLAVGILATHFFGTLLDWRLTALISIIFPILAFLTLFMIPEVPSYFIARNRHSEALKSFEWFRGWGARCEFDEIWEYYNEVEASGQQGDGSWSKLREALKNPEFFKPSLIIFGFFMIMQLSGPYIVAFYSVTILERTLGASINKFLIMNIIDVFRVAMTIAASILLRISRRRVLMLISGIGTALSMFILAGFSFSSRFTGEVSAYLWFLIFAFVSYIFFVSIGITVLPWCMTGELLPLNYRSLGASLNVAMNYVVFFAIIKVSPFMFEFCGMDGTFLFYGLVALVGTTVLFYVTPETKDRTIVDIVKSFRPNK